MNSFISRSQLLSADGPIPCVLVFQEWWWCSRAEHGIGRRGGVPCNSRKHCFSLNCLAILLDIWLQNRETWPTGACGLWEHLGAGQMAGGIVAMRTPQVLKDKCCSSRTKLKFRSGCIPLDMKDVPTNVCLSSGNMGFTSFILCCPGWCYMTTRATGEVYLQNWFWCESIFLDGRLVDKWSQIDVLERNYSMGKKGIYFNGTKDE